MKELSKEKTMTIKEIAEMLGVSTDLVQKRVRELYPEKMQARKTTYLNEMEVTIIKMRISENSSIISTGDDRHQLPKTQLEKKLLVKQAMDILVEEIEEIKLENEQLKLNELQNAPKVEYHDEVLNTENAFTTQQIAEEFGMTAQALNKLLKTKRVQYKKSGQYMLYLEHKGKGYTKTRTKSFKRRSGVKETTHYTVWTEKGRKFLHSVVKEDNYCLEGLDG